MSRNFVAPQQDKLQANLLSEHTLKNKLQKKSCYRSLRSYNT